MVITLGVVLLVLALVCFLLAAMAWPATRVQFGWLGLALVVLAALAGAHL